MATIDVVVRIDKFRIEKENEGSDDEPYVIPVFIVFDGQSSPTPLMPHTRGVRIHAPGPAHGSLGSKADGLPEGQTINVPAETGRFETELTTLPGFLFAAADAFTFIAVLIVGMEEDATSNAAAEAGRKALASGIRTQMNRIVRSPTMNGTVDSAQVSHDVIEAVKAETVDAWNFAAVSSLVNLGELVDPDDMVGTAIVGPLSFGSIARAPAGGMPFSRTLTGKGEGRYLVTGNVRRSDHPVVVSALTARGTQFVVAREDSRRFFVRHSQSEGFAEEFEPRTFSSGPAACRHDNRIDVFGRGDDRRIWQTWRTGSEPWHPWHAMGVGTFRAGPAAIARAGGRIDQFAVGDDDRIWQRSFKGHWSDWGADLDAAATGTFLHAAPAATSWSDTRIDLFALGKDSRIYHSRTDSGGVGWSTWAPLGDGVFFSGPSAVSWGEDRIDVVALGLDRRCYHLTWDNGWTNWGAIHNGTFFAGPGITSRSRHHLEVFAVGDDRRLWRAEWLPGPGWSPWKDDLGNVRFT